MRLVLLRADCDNGRTCPNINLTDRGTFVVQGYLTSRDETPGDALTVELPLSLVPELADGRSWPSARITDHGTVLMRGPEVTDEEALAELALPSGEGAIELPYDALPVLEGTHG